MEFWSRKFAAAAFVALLAFGLRLPTASGQSSAFLPPPEATIQQSEPNTIEPVAAGENISQELADWISPRQATAASATSPAAGANPQSHRSESSPAAMLPAASVAAPASGESLDYETPEFPEPIDLGSIVLRLFGGTAIVLAACVAFMWFGKNWITKGALFQGESNAMRVVETLGLAPGCCLKLVEIDGRRFAAAIDSTGIKELVPLGESFDESLAALENDEANETSDEPEAPNEPAAEQASVSPTASHVSVKPTIQTTSATKLSELLSAKEPGNANRRSA
ncbi:MAG: hypothetical protein NXI22_21700 [bacterium]|nr:hypothetical protein [bacterium]